MKRYESNTMNSDKIIEILHLEPLSTEGGYFRRTFRSGESVSAGCLPSRYRHKKSLYSCIYYLITPESFSLLHKLPSDEIFHFYLGDPVRMLQLHEDGTGEIVTIGNNLANGDRPHVLVPKNTWQGSRLLPGGDFALLGATVIPGFDDEDLVMAEEQNMVKKYPEYEGIIREYI
jgi:predicted cupin superfamily sugar epimerase